ncbi:MAG: MBL fold metallo-hydrolase [Granulosicoccaceae bacterium]
MNTLRQAVVFIVLGFPLLFSMAVPAEEVLADGDAFLAEVVGKVDDINTQQLQSLIDEAANLVLIDVRMAEEIASLGGTIDSGRTDLNINRGWLEFRIGDAVPDLNTPVVVFCGINQRSPLAAATLSRMGYKNIKNYADGVFAWRDAGLPMTFADEAPGTMLFKKPQEVSPNVYSAIGATAPATYENSGHNNNLSFIITSDGVVVINAGDNALLAQALHNEIEALTDQPVRYVVLENGQGHAMLGTDYWQTQGAMVIAHADAADQMRLHGDEILERMQRRNRDKAMGTILSEPDEEFDEEYILELGGVRIELKNLGPAHSPGDIVTWLPEQKLVISGDMAFHQRLLPVFEHTVTAEWIETWDTFAALDAQIVVPGHGEPTNMQEVTTYTVGYLKYMREKISAILDEGGSLIEAYQIDQSPYQHLDTFEQLSGLNADRMFKEMEFE